MCQTASVVAPAKQPQDRYHLCRCKAAEQLNCREEGVLEFTAHPRAAPWLVQAALHVKGLARIIRRPKVHSSARTGTRKSKHACFSRQSGRNTACCSRHTAWIRAVSCHSSPHKAVKLPQNARVYVAEGKAADCGIARGIGGEQGDIPA